MLYILFCLISCLQEIKQNKIYNKTKMSYTPILNIGEKEYCDTIAIPISLINTGNYPLIIKYIKTTCGCMQPILEKYKAEPSDSIIFTIKMSPQSDGWFSKVIYVFSNADKSPAKIIINGSIK